MYPPDKAWNPQFDWETPCGKVLRRLIDHLNTNSIECTITIFGSSPLQMTIDPNLLSNDVDFFASCDLSNSVRELGLGKDQSPYYLEQCPANVFRTCADWGQRVFLLKEKGVSVIFPHPIDILVSKVKRLENKDIRAFKVVYERTGHPQEAELIHALQNSVDIYAPGFDEENSGGDALLNTRTLWRELYNKDIDPRQKIIAPALEYRKRAYGKNLPDRKSDILDRLKSD